MSPHRRLFPLLAGASILFLSSCKSPSEVCSDPAICGGGPVATTVNVNPSTVALTSIGATEQLTATVLDQDGQTMSGASVTWSSSPTTVATVSGTGLVMAAGVGSAMVTATSGSASGSATVTVTDPCAPVGTIGVPGADAGALTASDCVISIADLGGGSHYSHRWTLQVSSTGFVQIDMISSDFDAYMQLRDDSGNLITSADDSHASGIVAYDFSPHIAQTLDAGTYRVVTTTYDDNVTGAYDLYVGDGLPCPEIGHVSSGDVVASSLDSGDCSYNSYYAEPYVIEVTSSGTVTFEMTSVEVDAYLTLYTPAGDILAENDDIDFNGGDYNSRISGTLEPGWYVIEASSSFGGEVGAYTLTVN